MRRLTATTATALLAFALLAFALLAPAAMAGDEGQGWYGEAGDKVITNAGFVLIAFFPIFVAVMSVIQWKLDKRKDARKKAAKARSARPEWDGGW